MFNLLPHHPSTEPPSQKSARTEFERCLTAQGSVEEEAQLIMRRLMDAYLRCPSAPVLPQAGTAPISGSRELLV